MIASQVTAADDERWIAEQLAAPLSGARCHVVTYRRPAVVLGPAQRALEIHGDLEVTRRVSGGGAVLAGPWMVSAAVVLPRGHALAPPSLVETYRWFAEVHREVLRASGVAAELVPPRAAPPVDAALRWACFAGVGSWELVVDGRKIVGLAQARRAHGVLLVSGTLLARPDWEALCRALGKPAAHAAALADVTVPADEVLGRTVDADAFAARLDRALAAEVAPDRENDVRSRP